MKIQSIRTIAGPNVWNHRPVLIMLLDLENLTEVASCDLDGFTQRLREILPGIDKHTCSPGYEGGFIERLERGTYFGHIVEHIALELSELSGIGVKYGKTVYGGREGLYQVVVQYQSAEAMSYLLEVAVELAQAVVDGENFALDEKITEAKQIVCDYQLGPSTQSIINAAEKKNIPWSRLNNENLIQLGLGKYRKFIQATTTGQTSDIGVEIAQDKNLAKKLLRDASIPVPQGEIVQSEEEAIAAFHELGSSVAMKPFDGNHGNGVCLDLSTEEAVRKSFRHAQNYSSKIIIEEFFTGHDYRVLVVGGKMIAASRRIPAHVVGDGKSTIAELVQRENENPLRGPGHEKAMTYLKLDHASEDFLLSQGLGSQSILSAGQIIYIKATANLSTGGSAIDVTDEVHPDIKLMCERAARSVGLDVCGIDLIFKDISKSWSKQQGGVIEVNAGPGIRMHHYPVKGQSRNVGEAIIDHMYPNHHNGRIPIAAITGTNGKTTVSRLMAHMIKEAGLVVGNTTTDGIFIDGCRVASGDTTGPASAKVILNDPGVEVAVLETARGGMIKRGLGFDWCDVGIITNIEADHIGQDGIESLEDILRVKSLVVERVREGGTIILNADSSHLMKMLADKKLHLKRKITLFSMDGDSKILRQHIDQGGRAFFLRGDGIYQAENQTENFLIRTHDFPISVGGTARFHVANALASIAGCVGMGLGMPEILAGLQSFHPGANTGRTNLYQIKKGLVLLDYGHNPEAIKAIGDMVATWNVNRVTAVLGAPGDRSDEMIQMSGLAAGCVFDKIILREDGDLRGRLLGETAGLLYQGVMQTNPGAECFAVIDSIQALERAMGEMRQDELVVYFYEDLDLVTNILKKHGAKQVHDFSRLVPISHGDYHEAVSWQ